MVPNHPRMMTKNTSIRLPDDLLERVDAYRDQVEKTSGYQPSRADVFRRALEKFLEDEAKAAKRRG